MRLHRPTAVRPAPVLFGQPAEPTVTPTSPVAADTPTPDGEETGPNAAPSGTLDPSVTPSRTVAPSATPTASSVPTETATPTPSPSPTQSPTPTLTPTPITGATATISTNGSTLWVRRTPGGTPLVIVTDGELVILLPGHANQGWHRVAGSADADRAGRAGCRRSFCCRRSSCGLLNELPA